MRHGTTNLFVAVEPTADHRTVSVTAPRGTLDFVAVVGELPHGTCAVTSVLT